jgi:hypothetical protein
MKLQVDPKKILIIRSSRFWHIRAILDELKEKFPDIRFSLLVSEGTQKSEIKSNLEEVEEILFWKGEKFNIFKYGYKRIKELKQKKFDLIVIPYNDLIGRGYWHIELFSLIVTNAEKNKVIVYDFQLGSYFFSIKLWVLKFLGEVLSTLFLIWTCTFFILKITFWKIFFFFKKHIFKN